MSYEDDRNIIRYLLQNAKLLEELHLSVAYGTSLEELLYPSLSARTLKVLDLTVPLYDEENSIILGGICEELEALAGHNMLETLSFKVHVFFARAEDFVGSTIQKVEKVLVRPGWPTLRRVSLEGSIAHSGAARELCETLQSLPDKYLVHLSNLESIAFDYSVYLARRQIHS
jgi:hypothetical protein